MPETRRTRPEMLCLQPRTDLRSHLGHCVANQCVGTKDLIFSDMIPIYMPLPLLTHRRPLNKSMYLCQVNCREEATNAELHDLLCIITEIEKREYTGSLTTALVKAFMMLLISCQYLHSNIHSVAKYSSSGNVGI